MTSARRLLFIGCAFAVLSLVMFRAVLNSGFLSDDYAFLIFAKHAGWRDLLTSYFPGIAKVPSAAYYRPVGLTLWKLSYLAFRENPVPYHLLSILIHAGNTLLVFVLATRLGQGTRTALSAAALFFVFPLHSETVDWLSCQFDLASVFFVLCCILCTLRESRRAWWVAGALALVSLGCKESAVVLPVLVVLVLWLKTEADPGIATGSRTGMRILPTVCAVTIYLTYRYIVLGGAGGHLAAAGAWSFQQVQEHARGLVERTLEFLLVPLNWGFLVGASQGLSFRAWMGVGILTLVIVGLVLAVPETQPTSRGGPGRCLSLILIWCGVSLALTFGTGRWNPTAFESARYLYLPAVGLAIGCAGLLFQSVILFRTDRGYRRAGGLRYLVFGICVFLSIGCLRARNLRWQQAGFEAEQILSEIQAQVPTPRPYATFVLPPLPDSHEGAYVFRNGIQEALRLRYDDDTLNVRGAALDPDGFIAFTWQNESLKLLPANHPRILVRQMRWWNPQIETMNLAGDFLYKDGEYQLTGMGRLVFRTREAAFVDLRFGQRTSAEVRMKVTSSDAPRAISTEGRGLLVRGISLPRGDSTVVLERVDREGVSVRDEAPVLFERISILPAVCVPERRTSTADVVEAVSTKVLPFDGTAHRGQTLVVLAGLRESHAAQEKDWRVVLTVGNGREVASAQIVSVEQVRELGCVSGIARIVVPREYGNDKYGLELVRPGVQQHLGDVRVEIDESIQPWR